MTGLLKVLVLSIWFLSTSKDILVFFLSIDIGQRADHTTTALQVTQSVFRSILCIEKTVAASRLEILERSLVTQSL